MTEESGDRRVRALELVAHVAEKALALGRVVEAERLLSTHVADFCAFAEHATSPDDLEIVARMYRILAPILPLLEAATGKPWTDCLDVAHRKSWNPRVPPVGQA